MVCWVAPGDVTVCDGLGTPPQQPAGAGALSLSFVCGSARIACVRKLQVWLAQAQAAGRVQV